jgi:hypothetical protein
MAKEILVLTSTNLACNPRCLKEVRLLSQKGYKVRLVAFHLHNWTTAKEQELNKELTTINFHYLDAGRKPLLTWLLSTVIEKAARVIAPLFRSGTFVSAMAITKRSWVLLRWAQRDKGDYSMIIAHNPPAFYAAARLAAKRNIPFALDIEDYHPGESNNTRVQANMTTLIRNLIPKAAYASYASPLIREYSERLLHRKPKDSFVINNIFSATDFPVPSVEVRGKIKVVWFSQYIDFDRGLEALIPALEKYADSFELTLIGNCREEFREKFVAGREFIRLMKPLSQERLHKTIGDFDIGLAIEPGRDVNNCVALSNKIWTYFQAGLFIFASDTPAQERFMSVYPDHGICIPLTTERIHAALNDLAGRIGEIRAEKVARFERAAGMGWEKEADGLLRQWQHILT